MTKYHIAKNGKAAPCGATVRPCPLGGEHYDSMREAAFAAVDRWDADLKARGLAPDWQAIGEAEHNRMQRPATMTDKDWDDFEDALKQRKLSLSDYEEYLVETESTLEQEWETSNRGHNYVHAPSERLVVAVGEHAQRKWKRSVALPLADEVLSRYLNPLQASLYAEEFSDRLIAFHDESPNGILKDYETTDQMADKALGWDRFQEATKAFMFDKLWGGEAA